MKNLLTKKNILLISGASSIALLLLDWVGTYKLCREYSVGSCPVVLHNFFGVISIFIPLFFFSLVTFKMRDEVFRAWWSFACWYTPVAMVIIALTPQYGGGIIMSPSPKGLAVVGTLLLFVFVSLAIVFRTWWKGRHEVKTAK